MKAVHFTNPYLLQPTNPVSVNLIGAGGTGSAMLTALARMNHSLIALNHPGLIVKVYDDDIVTEANRGRQLFAGCEVGLNKGVALISRLNRFFGTAWKATAQKFSFERYGTQQSPASITISCVDTVAARFEIAAALRKETKNSERDKPLYWMDFGNSRHTGQVILSTVGSIPQPPSKKFQPVPSLPFVTDEFADLLRSQTDNNEPSCSLTEALHRQDLFINSSLADMGGSLLWQLFREGMVFDRGFFLNLYCFHTQPLQIR